ncbi:decapping endonuclease targeting mRNA [Diatrype stigma]|uniref:Decapping nuclease n=1 Tax=Diatrype stigma TaxID=117547 RepID=A0AAN9UQ64_9PEZI
MSKHEFHLDDSSLQWYYPPELGADLSKGFDKFDKHDDSGDEHLDSLLKTIIAHEEQEGKRIDAHIVTWRGMITKKGSFANPTASFIEENHAYKQASQQEQKQQQQGRRGQFSPELMTYWVWDSKPAEKGQPVNWVELKTSAEIRDERAMNNFERKLMKFWIQSFLLGVPKIIVGFRSQGGVLTKLEEIQTAQIPETAARRGVRSWDANLCINFASGFLEWLRATIRDEGVWRIRRRPRSQTIEVFQVEEVGHGDVLTDEFINWRIKLNLKDTAS